MKNVKRYSAVLMLAAILACQFHQVQAVNKTKTLQVETVSKTKPQETVVKAKLLPVYENVISEISLEYSGALLSGDITLSNGEIFHIIDYRRRDDNAMNKWHAGDRVTFDSHVQKDKLILAMKKLHNGKPEDKAEPYVVFDNINSTQDCLKIIEVRENGKIIKLSDNSIWEFSFYNRLSTEDWKVGERVLVNGNGKDSHYSFINLDVPAKHNVYSATGTFVVN